MLAIEFCHESKVYKLLDNHSNNKAVIDSSIDDITGPGKVFTRH